MFATGKHKAVAKCASIEALLNFCLSIFLVKKIGIYGVAWGTSATMLLIHLSFWPAYVQRALNVPAWKYIWSGWGKITVSSIPFGIACAIAYRRWHANSLLIYFSQILITLPIYIISVSLVFRQEATDLFTKWYRRKSELKLTSSLSPDA
jgi:peptidoglycan biosynthesis protein MviN/MurJ (putative lipid II flippase)